MLIKMLVSKCQKLSFYWIRFQSFRLNNSMWFFPSINSIIQEFHKNLFIPEKYFKILYETPRTCLIFQPSKTRIWYVNSIAECVDIYKMLSYYDKFSSWLQIKEQYWILHRPVGRISFYDEAYVEIEWLGIRWWEIIRTTRKLFWSTRQFQTLFYKFLKILHFKYKRNLTRLMHSTSRKFSWKIMSPGD